VNIDSVYYFVIGPMCVFGMMSNVLSLSVLCRYIIMKHTTRFLLQCLAASDSFFLFISLLMMLLPKFIENYAEIVVISYIVPAFCQIPSVWMVVLVTTERFVAICWPLHAPRYCTMKRVRIAVSMLVVVFTIGVVSFAVCIFSESCSSKMSHPGLFIVFIVLNFVLPMSFIAFFNFHLIKSVRESYAIRRQQVNICCDANGDVTASSAANNELKCTLQLITVASVFFICQTPQIMSLVLLTLSRSTFSWGALLLQFNLANNVLMAINSTANFFIYCLAGGQFRRAVCQCLRCEPSD
jgi:hypothetical protein